MGDIVLADVRDKLLKLREELEAVAATSEQSSQTVELDQARVGRLSRMDALQAQAMAKESGRRREATLRRITAALERVENGDYGLCQFNVPSALKTRRDRCLLKAASTRL